MRIVPSWQAIANFSPVESTAIRRILPQSNGK